METHKYQKYLKEISLVYDLTFVETEAFFSQAVALAYDALGSAVIHSDGTIMVLVKEPGRNPYLKHYIISTVKYERIMRIFTKRLDEYSKKKDSLFFATALKQKIINVKIISENESEYFATPVLTLVAIERYKFNLPKKKVFFNEKLYKNEITEVVCNGFNTKSKKVVLSRFHEAVVSELFLKELNQNIQALDSNYSMKNFDIKLNDKNRAVIINVFWSKKPSSFFISFLTKELQSKFGRCSILSKEMFLEKESEVV